MLARASTTPSRTNNLMFGLSAAATPAMFKSSDSVHHLEHLDYSAPEPMMGVSDEDFYYPRELEASFCRDFSCCGLILNDLHDLLQHYEECHVRFEDDDAQADLSDGCFFDDEWSSEDCLTSQEQTQAPSASDLASYGLSLEHHLLLSAATSTSTAVSTAVPSPTLSCKDASTGTSKAMASSPPLSPTTTATSSVLNSPYEAALNYASDGASAGGRKRSAAGAAEQAHAKKQATASASAAAAAKAAVDLAFPSSVLGLYDDDIIAAIASATDPLFLSSAAAAAAGNGQEASLHHNSALAHVANAAVAVVSGDYDEDSDEDSIHLPPSVTAAMAGAVAAAAAAKAHGLLPRDDKPYRCPITGCDKAYKNPNGLKYHNLHGHCNMGEDLRASSKPYKCRVPECYKAYKNLNGLKYHVQHAHCAMIPSIRDLPANATPAEVAAAVAQAAAHAAAQAVAASAPVSPMPSPSPSAAPSPMSAGPPPNRAPMRTSLPPSSSSAPGSGIRLQPPPLRTGPGAIRSPMGPQQQHRPMTQPQQRIGGGPAPSGMPPRPAAGQIMMANRRPANFTSQQQQQSTLSSAGPPRPRPLTSLSPASAGQTPVNGSMPIRRPAPPAAGAPAPVAATAPRQPALQATASC